MCVCVCVILIGPLVSLYVVVAFKGITDCEHLTEYSQLRASIISRCVCVSVSLVFSICIPFFPFPYISVSFYKVDSYFGVSPTVVVLYISLNGNASIPGSIENAVAEGIAQLFVFLLCFTAVGFGSFFFVTHARYICLPFSICHKYDKFFMFRYICV